MNLKTQRNSKNELKTKINPKLYIPPNTTLKLKDFKEEFEELEIFNYIKDF